MDRQGRSYWKWSARAEYHVALIDQVLRIVGAFGMVGGPVAMFAAALTGSWANAWWQVLVMIVALFVSFVWFVVGFVTWRDWRKTRNLPKLVTEDKSKLLKVSSTVHQIRNEFLNERVWVPGLVDPDGVLRNKSFIRCELVGPVVLCPTGANINIIEPTFHASHATSTLLDVADDGQVPDGAVGLAEVQMVSCSFHRVTMCGRKENMDQIRQILGIATESKEPLDE